MMATQRLKVISGHLKKNFDNNSTIYSPSVNNCSASLVQDREFCYTHNGNHLSHEQRIFYEDNGYLVIKNLISDQVLNKCRDHFIDICNGVCPKLGMTLMKEPTLLKAGASGEHLYYKAQELLHDDVFSKYCELPELLDYVMYFTGPNITAIHSMLINKPPDAPNTTIHPLHQDLLYFPFRPADLIVGVWTAMERVDTDNGCLVVIPGSHTRGQLYRHGLDNSQKGAYETFFGVRSADSDKTIPLCMEKGDTVFLHPLVIHGSGPNRSKRFRKAISCHYAASECGVIDIKNSAHEDIAGQIEAMAKKIGVPVDFTTAMKLRSKVVRGTEGFSSTL